MTFQHSGHGCLGAGGTLGAIGIHLPDPKSLQDTINEHHERVTRSVQEHVNEHHDRVTQVQQGVRDHINDVRDAVQNHIGGGGGGGGESVGGGAPLHLIFGDPVAAEAHHYSLAAIPVG